MRETTAVVNYGTRITAAVQADVTSAIGSRLLEL